MQCNYIMQEGAGALAGPCCVPRPAGGAGGRFGARSGGFVRCRNSWAPPPAVGRQRPRAGSANSAVWRELFWNNWYGRGYWNQRYSGGVVKAGARIERFCEHTVAGAAWQHQTRPWDLRRGQARTSQRRRSSVRLCVCLGLYYSSVSYTAPSGGGAGALQERGAWMHGSRILKAMWWSPTAQGWSAKEETVISCREFYVTY